MPGTTLADAPVTDPARHLWIKAFNDGRHDYIAAPVIRNADYTRPMLRAHMTKNRSSTCGSVNVLPEMSAPLFIASESARKLAAAKAPYGLMMGGQTEAQMTAKIRKYRRNSSLPLTCQFATCAVVGSSGALRNANFGAAIDAHDAVIRINAAPTRRFEVAVGARTTWRVHNSEKPYMMAARGLPELQVSICHMSWIGSCQHQAFSGAFADTLAYVNPRFYSQLFSLLGRPRDKQSPSTGLLAIALALGVCGRVRIFGFGSAGGSAGRRCKHYWECLPWEDESKYHDPLHSFHDWQAEERLREIWLEHGVIDDGTAIPATTVSGGAPRNDTLVRARWISARRHWLHDLRAFARARDERRRKGIGPGGGGAAAYSETTHELLARHRTAKGKGGGGGKGKGNGAARVPRLRRWPGAGAQAVSR